MTKSGTFITALFTSLLLAGCGGTSTSDKEVELTKSTASEITATDSSEQDSKVEEAAQAKKYLDDVRAPYQELIELGTNWDKLRSDSASGDLEDAELGEIISSEVIPQNMTLLEQVENIVAPNEEIAEINEILISAIGDQQLAFTEILSAIETGDSSKVTSANSILNDVRKSDREFSRKIENLLANYNIDTE